MQCAILVCAEFAMFIEEKDQLKDGCHVNNQPDEDLKYEHK